MSLCFTKNGGTGGLACDFPVCSGVDQRFFSLVGPRNNPYCYLTSSLVVLFCFGVGWNSTLSPISASSLVALQRAFQHADCLNKLSRLLDGIKRICDPRQALRVLPARSLRCGMVGRLSIFMSGLLAARSLCAFVGSLVTLEHDLLVTHHFKVYRQRLQDIYVFFRTQTHKKFCFGVHSQKRQSHALEIHWQFSFLQRSNSPRSALVLSLPFPRTKAHQLRHGQCDTACVAI